MDTRRSHGSALSPLRRTRCPQGHVACVRCVTTAKVQEVRTFGTTTSELLALSGWLDSWGCTHVAMEATGVYWKPVWHLLEDHFELVLANAQHVRNVPGRKTDVNDAMWIDFDNVKGTHPRGF